MAFENFIGSCDHCAARCQQVYDRFPTCRECEDDICPNCAHPGTTSGPDVDAPELVTCKRCVTTDRPCDVTETGIHNGAPGDYCKACGYGLPDEDPRTAESERDNATFAETHGGEL